MSVRCATVRFTATRLTYQDACALARRIQARPRWELFVLDLEQTTDTSTAALARLVGLRRDLLAGGRDLRLLGLHGRANDLYELSRLGRILPRLEPPSHAAAAGRVA